ncbi:MAG: hypothetical protein ACREIA_18525, partial [Opitutaceae bacterium]
MESEIYQYHFSGQLRWAWFFENPNAFACLLATALPISWIAIDVRQEASKCRSVAVALLVAEGLAWWVLAKTYSRGGLAAALGGLLFYYLLTSFKPALSPLRRMAALFGFRIVVVAFCLY